MRDRRAADENVALGIDVRDRHCHACVLDASGGVIEVLKTPYCGRGGASAVLGHGRNPERARDRYLPHLNRGRTALADP